MDAVDFLNGDIAELPKERAGDFPRFISRVFDEYRAEVLRVTNATFLGRLIRNELQRIDPLSNALRDVVALATSGSPDAAYNRLDTALTVLGPHLRALMPSGDMSHHVNPLYRFRATGDKPYFKGDLFHIPFYLRRIVQPMRYSVAGLPCLYLGGSTHVCWKELREPDLTRTSVTRFQAIPNTNLRVLNFGYRLPHLAALVDHYPHLFTSLTSEAIMVVAHVACWPLVAACSIRVPDPASPERPEYIVPQLMLRWITSTLAFHGIRYFSTHYNTYPDEPKICMNYVFPARTTPPVGYCPELCDLFELTEPSTWSDAKAAPLTTARHAPYRFLRVLDSALDAEYGRAEDGLLGMPVGPLQSFPAELKAAIHLALQKRAYGFWKAGGELHGKDREHWFRAKTEMGIPDSIHI